MGENAGTVSNSYSTGSVSGAGVNIGGLIGENNGSVSRSYSTSMINGPDSVGGLVGFNRGTVSNSLWDIETSGQTTGAGGTGKTTAEMQMAGTFLDAGWDFVGETANGTEDIWWILEGQDYPQLWWEGGDEASQF